MKLPLPRGTLVVSCQARPDNPLHGAGFMAAMAMAAVAGGAAAIRANGAADIAAIHRAVPVPIIGLRKRHTPGFAVEITPAIKDATEVVAAGADIVAVDATHRPRDGEGVAEVIAAIRTTLVRPVLADIATVAEAQAAVMAGADAVATTLSGYTEATLTSRDAAPDLALVAQLAATLPVPVIAEGRFWSPDEVARAFDAGAWAVVIGTAITNPREITRRFVAALPITARSEGAC